MNIQEFKKFGAIGEFCTIDSSVEIGHDVVIGNRVTLFPGVHVDDGARILDGAVIGRLTYRTSAVSRGAPADFQPTAIGRGSVIGCNSVIYTGVEIGARCLLADGVSIREGCRLAPEVLLGRYVTLNYESHIGARTRIMDYTHITGNAVVGDDCFISIHVGTANDNDVYLNRFGLGQSPGDLGLVGPRIGHYVVIGTGASINPGVRIGDGALVGAGALVTRDISPWTVVMGAPARFVRAIPSDWYELISARARSLGQELSPRANDPL